MILKGIAAAPGYAIGKVFLYCKAEPVVASAGAQALGTPQEEAKRLEAAIEASNRELESLALDMERKVGAAKAAIFHSHQALLRDPEIMGPALDATRKGSSAEAAISAIIEETAALFEGMDDDPVLKERGADMRDVGRRILSHLGGCSERGIASIPAGSILVADELQPSDTAVLDPASILAFAVGKGGATSHSAILAKAMGLVAVVGLGDISGIKDGAEVVVDGCTGEIIVDPDPELIASYEAKRETWLAERSRLAGLAKKDTYTRSGRRVIVAANIGSPSDVDACLSNGAEGIGLFRTEFLFMKRNSAPSEDEQFEAYKSVLQEMAPRPVVIRTLDIGGDKEVPYLGLAKDENPFLGLRAIRLCLRDRALFATQLRALLRASAFGKLGIMFPMISSIEELRAAKAALAECSAELGSSGVATGKDLDIGIMIEIPSAALIADDLAAECDFFSIGTNDLTQYTLAVDRMNESVAALYRPTHPAVLRLIKMSIEAAHRHGITCAMCGELASDPTTIPTLLAYGLDEFSMSSSSMPSAKELIARSD
jgi:phosphotransferase system enzyme I (PtsI)